MLPNFIVIGAAKAGTTALYWYLAEHPAVFMSAVKETNYFAYGLDARGQPLYGDPEVHKFPIKTLREYEQLFADVGSAVAIGEASPIYLECPQSAGRMRQQIPGAKLVCSLRHPVDRAYSDYQMYLLQTGQRLDPARDLTPSAAWAHPASRWMQIGRYYEQLKRYFEVFPANQLHIFLFDDLSSEGLLTVQNIYRFLGVDPWFRPDFDAPHNVSGLPRSRVVEGLLTSRRLRAAVEPWIPRPATSWIRRLRMKNMRRPPQLPAQMRQDLTSHFRDDIRRTSDLIGRSLEHWL